MRASRSSRGVSAGSTSNAREYGFQRCTLEVHEELNLDARGGDLCLTSIRTCPLPLAFACLIPQDRSLRPSCRLPQSSPRRPISVTISA